MAKIITKNSFTPGSAPSGLSAGEIAVNVADKKIFVGNAVGGVVTLHDQNAVVTSVNGATGAVTNINAATSTITNTNSSSTFYPAFVGGTGATGFFIDAVSTPLSYVPSSGTVSARAFDATFTTNQVKLDAALGTIFNTDGTNTNTVVAYGFEYNGASPYIFYSGSQRIFLVTQGLQISDGDYDQIYGPSTWGYTFPASNGTSGQAMLTNGSGQLYWGTVASSSSSGVLSLNGLTGIVGIAAGSNITITPSGNTLTISSSGGGGGGGIGFTYASSAPSTPAIGDRWLDSDTGKEYVYVNDGDSSQWIEPVSSNGLVGVTYTSATNLLQFGLTGSFLKLGIGTTAPANTLDVVGGISATTTTNTIDIIASTDGAGLRIAQATSGGSSRIGGIRLGRGTAAGSNTYLENDSGVFTIYNGIDTTGTNLFNINTAEGAQFNVPIAGATFSAAVVSDGGYRITSNAINALTGTTYSLLTSDNGKIITWSNAGGVTLTVPSGLPVGFNTTVIQIGAGAVGITGSGTTLNSFEGKLRTAGQHAAVSIISYSSNVFNIAGGLTA
jgi:hypothetical protein